MPATPLKRIRVDDTLWDAFGGATAALGLDRTKVLVAYMRRVVDAMALPTRTDGPDHAAARPDSAT